MHCPLYKDPSTVSLGGAKIDVLASNWSRTQSLRKLKFLVIGFDIFYRKNPNAKLLKQISTKHIHFSCALLSQTILKSTLVVGINLHAKVVNRTSLCSF